MSTIKHKIGLLLVAISLQSLIAQPLITFGQSRTSKRPAAKLRGDTGDSGSEGKTGRPSVEEDRPQEPSSTDGETVETTEDVPSAQDSTSTDGDGPLNGPQSASQFEKLIAEAKRHGSAKEALEALRVLKSNTDLTESQMARLRKEILAAEEAVKNKLVRMGKGWVTASEGTQRVKDADEAIRKSEALMKVSDFKGARQQLEKASKTDQNGIRADFLLGLLHSPLMARNNESAEKYFERVLQRSPDHVPALNNLALAEIRQKKYSQGLVHFRDAARLAPRALEISHNVGLVILAAKNGLIRLTPREQTDFRDLYAQLIVDATEQNSDAQVNRSRGGWRWMLPTLSRDEQKRVPIEGNANLRDYASGTGFVVAPEYVLTNFHVVKDADAVLIEVVEDNKEHVLSAEVVARANNVDLALLRIPDLTLPAVSISMDPPRRGTDILILGYPESQFLGKTLKATRGSITSLPADELGGMLLFDATANPGNSGGPVCDKSANVVGVLTAAIRLEQRLTAGIPAQAAIDFLEKHVPDFEVSPQDEELDWPDVDSHVARSTVFIRTQRRYYQVAMKTDRTQPGQGESWLEDNSCLVCSGTGVLPCNAGGCVRGVVSVRGREAVANERLSGGTISAPVVRKKACAECNGTGRRNCPYCSIRLE